MVGCAKLSSAKAKVVAVIEVRETGGALVAHSRQGKTGFLKLHLPATNLDETEGKSACTAMNLHESSSMTTILLPIRDPLPQRPDYEGADVSYIRLHFVTEIGRRPAFSPSLHPHDQKNRERHDR